MTKESKKSLMLRKYIKEQVDTKEVSKTLNISIKQWSDLLAGNPIELIIVLLVMAGFSAVLLALIAIGFVVSTVIFPFRKSLKFGKWIYKKFSKKNELGFKPSVNIVKVKKGA